MALHSYVCGFGYFLLLQQQTNYKAFSLVDEHTSRQFQLISNFDEQVTKLDTKEKKTLACLGA